MARPKHSGDDSDEPGSRHRAEKNASAQPPSEGGECILIIEDNPLNMKLFRDLLQAQGYQTLEASDGQSGLDLARAEHPDLVLLDLHLPDISGLQVAVELKSDKRTDDVPILVVTASILPEAERSALATGCDAFLTKPITISQFRAAVLSLLQRRRVGSKRERSV